MSSPFIVRPLAREQIHQAFPVVIVLDPGLSLESWSDYAMSYLRNPADDDHRGILTVQSEQGYIYGLTACRVRMELRRGRVLEAENFVSLDLTSGRRAAKILLEATEDQAERWACRYICLLLPGARAWRAQQLRSHPATELFKTAGYEEEPFRFGKSCVAAE